MQQSFIDDMWQTEAIINTLIKNTVLLTHTTIITHGISFLQMEKNSKENDTVHVLNNLQLQFALKKDK